MSEAGEVALLQVFAKEGFVNSSFRAAVCCTQQKVRSSMKTNASRGKSGRSLLLSVLIIGSMLLTAGFGGLPAAASEGTDESLPPGEVIQDTANAFGETAAPDGPEATQDSGLTPPDETAVAEESAATSEPAASEPAGQSEAMPENEAASIGDMSGRAAVGLAMPRPSTTLKFSVVETG